MIWLISNREETSTPARGETSTPARGSVGTKRVHTIEKKRVHTIGKEDWHYNIVILLLSACKGTQTKLGVPISKPLITISLSKSNNDH